MVPTLPPQAAFNRICGKLGLNDIDGEEGDIVNVPGGYALHSTSYCMSDGDEEGGKESAAPADENLQVVQLHESFSASKKRLSTSLSAHKWLSTAHFHATFFF